MRPILVVVVIAVAAVIVYLGWPSAPPDTEPRVDAVVEPAVVETSATAAAPAPEQAGADPVITPSFDVVRISPEGNAVIAGRAEPGAEVEVTVGDAVIATVTADDRGEWVAVPETPIEPGSRQLALTQRTVEGETVASESVVILLVPERPVVGESANQGALALVMPRDDVGGATLLQTPTAGVGLKGSEDFSLDTIEYDKNGAFALSGRAEPYSQITAYIDNRFIGNATADKNEIWRITPDALITPGLHKLRVDQIDATGNVIARLETPFSRAEFLLPSDVNALVVVQPGNSLWRIARRRYGLGPQYVHIFEANRDQIMDPDLIYPGQIFELPTVN